VKKTPATPTAERCGHCWDCVSGLPCPIYSTDEPTAPQRECITHHFACDCRERKFAELEQKYEELQAAYKDRALAMQETGDVVRGLYEARLEQMRKERDRALKALNT
jgi:coenzyme F420-reducing hydrogenase beta subunit